MNTKQLEYILKIAEENNITHAAEKLFITQSALNQQLLRLEEELGTPLFYRSRTNWHPTEAGEIYIKNAKEMCRIKKATYSQIRDVANTKNGTLSVGFTPGRGIAMFGAVYPDFHKIYPDIIVTPVEHGVRELQALISNDQLDIGFLTLTESDYTKDEYIPLLEEEIFLVIPEGHPLESFAAPNGFPFSTIDLTQCRYEPFVIMNKNSTMRSLVDQIFEKASFKPNILFETRNHTTVISMIRSKICCGLIPHYYIKKQHDGMICFSIPDHPTWQVAASYRKGSYLSNAARCFIELARSQWNN